MKQISLNRNWLFEKPESAPEQVDIPHCWNRLDGQNGGNNYFRGLCSYSREEEVSLIEGERAFVEFEGANSIATLTVNGTEIGTHRGGYSTFRFEITDALKAEGKNSIRLDVDNSHVEDVYPLMADFTFMGGMYRDARLLIVPASHFDLKDAGSSSLYLRQQHVSAELAEIEAESRLTLAAKSTGEYRLQLTVADSRGRLVATASSLVESAKTVSSLSVKQKFVIENPRLWNGMEDPHCYEVTLQLFDGETLLDQRKQPLGVRTFTVLPDSGFHLNGKPLELRGVSRHQDKKDMGWALTSVEMEEDIAIMKEMGVNSIRLAHYQHNQYFYELCDREGFVVWAEIPYISMSSDTDHTGSNAKEQMIELISQNFNHPSIFMWGVQNEITIGDKQESTEEIVKMLDKLCREMDPSRLTAQAQVGHHPDDDSMNGITDLLGYNKYFGWYYDEVEEFSSWLDQFHKRFPQIPLGITEYGCEGILNYHTDSPKRSDYTEEYQMIYHQKALAIFSERKYLWGTYVWNMFDFASDMRDEGGVKGMNNKGLVTHDRSTRKDSFYIYQARWIDSPVLHLAGKRFINRKKGKTVIHVITNEPKVELRVNGKRVAEGIPENNLVTFTGIKVGSGLQTLSVFSENCSDAMEVNGVRKADPAYTCPEENSNPIGDVGNWFETGDSDAEVAPLEFPEGYYSIRDKISLLLKNEETLAVLTKEMPQMYDHPMFGMVKNMSIERVIALKPDAFPAAFISKINIQLTKIPKK